MVTYLSVIFLKVEDLKVTDLTSYGKRYLGLLYKKYSDNTDFLSFHDFCDYMSENNFRDWKIIKLDVEQVGLRKDNIIIDINKVKVRNNKLNLFNDNLSYGDKVLLLKEFSANLEKISELYQENIFFIDRLKSDGTNNDLLKLRAYMSNGVNNLSHVLELLDNLDI